ncbi:hypothetical protein RND81_10G176100 [Saponaria officinalis]|uniref:FAS1 domain-containing protein n=1 Tax=Saponaria officinalis TaxID=3572 RepID=A0AAW1I4K8_SAPOF
MAHMASKYVILAIMFLCATNISAFNITRLLNNHPQFSTFNDLLTQTGVAAEINKRQTITVLVIDNSGMGPISSKPQSTIKKILQTHALLDYYDTNKISDLSIKSGSTAINFFQNTGTAYREQGQTRIVNSGGDIIFASAMKGAPHDSKMVKSIAAQPYNISVIEISQPIVTPGLDQTAPSGPSTSPVAVPVPAQQPKKAEAPAPAVEGPTEDMGSADGPASEGPSVGDEPSSAPGPAQDGDVADKESPAKLAPPPKSGGSQLTFGAAYVVVFGILGLLSLM